MEALLHQGKVFEKISYPAKAIMNREFEDCTFRNCDFSNGDFSQNRFTDCVFIGCNLAMLKLNRSTLSNVTFRDSKLTGIDFSKCESGLFTVRFESCLLDYTSFAGKKMPRTHFVNCSLKNAVFEQVTLTKAQFDNCDLAGAIFSNALLGEANFTTAYNYSLDPEINNIKKAKFSQHGLSGLLAKYDIQVE